VRYGKGLTPCFEEKLKNPLKTFDIILPQVEEKLAFVQINRTNDEKMS
jgi:hypothetical protein